MFWLANWGTVWQIEDVVGVWCFCSLNSHSSVPHLFLVPCLWVEYLVCGFPVRFCLGCCAIMSVLFDVRALQKCDRLRNCSQIEDVVGVWCFCSLNSHSSVPHLFLVPCLWVEYLVCGFPVRFCLGCCAIMTVLFDVRALQKCDRLRNCSQIEDVVGVWCFCSLNSHSSVPHLFLVPCLWVGYLVCGFPACS